MTGRVIGLGLLGLFAILGLTVLFGSWYTIDETQRGVLLRNGAFSRVVQPGLGFKLPMVDSVVKVDMQTHKLVYGVDSKGASTMEAYSMDSQPAFLRVSVTLHTAPDKVGEMYSRFGGDFAAAVARTIEPHVYARTKIVFGGYTAATAISKRGALNDASTEAIRQAIAYDPVFVIESVQIENISWSGEYIKSVEQRMQAEVEVQKVQQNLAKEKVSAEIAVTQAKGRADSVLAEKKAEADGIKLIGDAQAEAVRAKGAALRDNANLVALIQAERWNGALPTTMPPNGTVPMLALGK